MFTQAQNTGKSTLRLTLLGAATACAMLLTVTATTASASPEDHASAHAAHGGGNSKAPAKLVQIVRTATRQYMDVNMATNANYKPLFGCVTGPESGAMGVHYINLTLVGDGEIDGQKPEALIYEPGPEGMRLVGVEYIVDAAAWSARHSAPPMLENQAFQLVGSPNRYGLPPFYELHVWAWRDNPNGAFVDWNTKVTCEEQ